MEKARNSLETRLSSSNIASDRENCDLSKLARNSCEAEGCIKIEFQSRNSVSSGNSIRIPWPGVASSIGPGPLCATFFDMTLPVFGKGRPRRLRASRRDHSTDLHRGCSVLALHRLARERHGPRRCRRQTRDDRDGVRGSQLRRSRAGVLFMWLRAEVPAFVLEK